MLLDFSFIVVLEALSCITGDKRFLMKHTIRTVTIVFLACSLVSLRANETEIGQDFSFDLDLLDPGASSANKPLPCAPNVCIADTEFQNLEPQPPDTIVALLTGGPLHLQDTLIADLYFHTNPLTHRSIHTIPSVAMLLQDVPPCGWSVTVKPFLRSIPRARFTPKSYNVLTYLSFLTINDFIEDIDIDEFQRLNIPEVLPLFKNMQLQQREFGGMFSLQYNGERCIWTLTLPVLYLENNWFLTEKEQEAIQNSTLFNGGDTPRPSLTPSLDFSTFTEDHLINDKAGIGDLRTEIWYDLCPHHEHCSAFVGGQVTFPTARALLSGIAGAPDSVFCTKIIPYFDIQTMFNLYSASLSGDQNAAVALSTMVASSGIAALDRLSTILLNNPLGTQHASVGPVFRADAYSKYHSFGIQVTGDIAYYIPQHELRFFKTIKNPQAFDRDYNDSAQAQANLNFLMQQATDTLYPTAVCIKVHPGWTINLTGAFRFLRPDFELTFGYNLWAKTKEHFSPIEDSYGICDPFAALYPEPRYNVQKVLDITAGQSAHALQGKLFASVTATITPGHSYNIRTGLRADATIHNYNLGADYTVAVDFILDF